MARARKPQRNPPLNGEPIRADADAINHDAQVSNFDAQKECAKGKGAKVVKFAEKVEFLNGNSSGVGVLESEDDDGAGNSSYVQQFVRKGRVRKRKALKGALKPKENLLDGANRVAAAMTIETRSRRRAQSLVDNGFDDAVEKGNFMDQEAAQNTQRCSIEFEADVDNNWENGGVRKKRRGRKRRTLKRRGRKRKTLMNEVSSGENAENEVLGANVELEMNGDSSGSSARGRKFNVQEKPKVNKRDPKVT